MNKMSEETKSNAINICGLCEENTSKYCCPRCEVFYCSLNCYKSEKHHDCSESFYRDCVNQELALNQADDNAKSKMIDVLKKLQNNDLDDLHQDLDEVDEGVDSDDETDIDLQSRIKNLNLDDADAVWGALTEDERNEFEALLNQGDIGSILPQWEPWWIFRKEKKLVEETDSNLEVEALKKCPCIKTVPKFSTLTTVQPSPAITYNIANIIASYVFVMRYFNAELESVEVTACLMDICNNLSTNMNFEEFDTAVESVKQQCIQSKLIETDEASLAVMKNDTLLVLQGPSGENAAHYCRAALSHLIQILNDAKSRPKQTIYEENITKGEFSRKFPEHKTNHFPALDFSKVRKSIKKLEYYLSFVQSCIEEN